MSFGQRRSVAFGELADAPVRVCERPVPLHGGGELASHLSSTTSDLIFIFGELRILRVELRV